MAHQVVDIFFGSTHLVEFWVAMEFGLSKLNLYSRKKYFEPVLFFARNTNSRWK